MQFHSVKHKLLSITVGERVLEPVDQDGYSLNKEKIINPSVNFVVDRSILLLKKFAEKEYPAKKITFISEERVSKKDMFSLNVYIYACSEEDTALDVVTLARFKALLHEFAYKAGGSSESIFSSYKQAPLNTEEQEFTQEHIDLLAEKVEGKKISRPFTMVLSSEDGSAVEIPFSKAFVQPVKEGGEESDLEEFFAYVDGARGSEGEVYLRRINEDTYGPSPTSLPHKVDRLDLVKQASLLYGENEHPLVKVSAYTKTASKNKKERRVASIEPASLEELALAFQKPNSLDL